MRVLSQSPLLCPREHAIRAKKAPARNFETPLDYVMISQYFYGEPGEKARNHGRRNCTELWIRIAIRQTANKNEQERSACG
jgi:hypothetical protein